MNHFIFSSCFKSGSCYSKIYAFFYIKIIFNRNSSCFFNQMFFIWFAHIGKTRTKFFNIFSNQRIMNINTNMISNDHNISNFK